MMQTGANLILPAISDTTVTGWVSRLRAKCVNTEIDENHICPKALNLAGFKQQPGQNNESSSVWFNTVRLPPQEEPSDTFTAGTHLL